MSGRNGSGIAGQVDETDARPIDRAVAGAREYLHLPDPTPYFFAAAVAVTTALSGPPLWGLLVGASSTGKTESIDALQDVADERVDRVTEAALLAWSKGKKPTPTGILSRHPERVFFTIADLSTVLAMVRDKRAELFAALRRVYDGRYVREVGQATEPLVWEGKATALAAVTPAIDDYGAHEDALGVRWLYLRLHDLAPADRRIAAAKARHHNTAATVRQRATARKLLGEAVCGARDLVSNVELTPPLEEALQDTAEAAAFGRAAVQRSPGGRREIIGIPSLEGPGRISGQLAQLARGLLALGLTDTDAASVCRRAALDSMPQPRRRVLDVLVTASSPTSGRGIARAAAVHPQVATRALEDLFAIGVVEEVIGDDAADEHPAGRPRYWSLAEEGTEVIRRVMALPDRHQASPHCSLLSQQGERG